MVQRFPLWASFVAIAYGCGGSPIVPVEENDRGVAQFAIVSGQGQADTIGATLEPFVFELRDAVGEPYAGELVLLNANVVNGRPTVRFRMEPSDPWQAVLVTRADAVGRIAVEASAGDHAGPGTLRLSGVEVGGSGAIAVQVDAGAPVDVDLTVTDTIAIAGDTVPVVARTWDRAGNLRSEGPELAVAGSGEVVPGGVHASDPGHVTVVGAAGDARDSLGLGFLPAGRVFYLQHFGHASASRLDGSRRVRLDVSGIGGMDADPAGTNGILSDGRIRILNFPGAASRVTGGDADELFIRESWPRYSPDGQWIYFTAVFSSEGASVWRVRPSGADLERITSVASQYHGDLYPSVSSSGDFLAYAEVRTASGQNGPLVVRDLQTDAVTPLGVSGTASRWSPDDQWIAYLDLQGRLRLVRPTGLDDRDLIPRSETFGRGFDWSPDGRFIVAVTTRGEARLIEVGTGRLTPLEPGFAVTEVAWFRTP